MLLINPATEKFGGFLSRYVPVGIPVSIGCIAAYLGKHDIRCNVIDEEIFDITPSLLREAVEGLEKPYIFGLTCMTAHIGRAAEIARMIKAEFPDSTVVAGGLHPTILPEEVLKTEEIDYVVRGEGEAVMLRLYQTIRASDNAEKILGLSFIRDGAVFSTPQAPLIPDINEIPTFPYHLFENPKYDMGFLSTSRGCPYRCSYCSIRKMTGFTYRFKSAENIIKDLDVLVNKYKQNAVVFYDDNFCLNARRLHDVCDMIIEKGFHEKVDFSVQTRADNVLKHGGDDLVRHMAEAGFTHMGFGMETGVQRLADLIRKDETIECHMEAVALCRKYGMDVSLFMIFGLPTETAEDRKTSYDLVKSTNVVATKYNNLIPYPGTPLFNELKDGGRIVIDENWKNFNSVLSMTTSIFDKTPLPYVPETTSEWELKRDIIRYNLKSYVSWKSIGSILGHTKGIGWFMLPKKWYLKPRELFEMSKIAAYLIINIVITFAPLRLSEPIMTALNPRMKNRPKIKDYDPESYVICDWDKEESKKISILLKDAKDEKGATGKFSVLLGDRPAAEFNDSPPRRASVDISEKLK